MSPSLYFHMLLSQVVTKWGLSWELNMTPVAQEIIITLLRFSSSKLKLLVHFLALDLFLPINNIKIFEFLSDIHLSIIYHLYPSIIFHSHPNKSLYPHLRKEEKGKIEVSILTGPSL